MQALEAGELRDRALETAAETIRFHGAAHLEEQIITVYLRAAAPAADAGEWTSSRADPHRRPGQERPPGAAGRPRANGEGNRLTMLEDKISVAEAKLRDSDLAGRTAREIRQIAENAVLAGEYGTAVDRLTACRRRLDDAARLQRAALTEIGHALRRQEAILGQYQNTQLRMDPELAGEITGLPQSALRKAIQDTAGADDERDPALWSDERLARAIEDGYPGKDADRDEFRLRFPFVAALSDAIEVLSRRDPERPGDPMDWLEHAPPGSGLLHDERKDRLAEIRDRASWPDGRFRHSQGPATWL
jgi:hypothetical protein